MHPISDHRYDDDHCQTCGVMLSEDNDERWCDRCLLVRALELERVRVYRAPHHVPGAGTDTY